MLSQHKENVCDFVNKCLFCLVGACMQRVCGSVLCELVSPEKKSLNGNSSQPDQVDVTARIELALC